MFRCVVPLGWVGFRRGVSWGLSRALLGVAEAMDDGFCQFRGGFLVLGSLTWRVLRRVLGDRFACVVAEATFRFCLSVWHLHKSSRGLGCFSLDSHESYQVLSVLILL
jgi:hypothetical protein